MIATTAAWLVPSRGEPVPMLDRGDGREHRAHRAIARRGQLDRSTQRLRLDGTTDSMLDADGGEDPRVRVGRLAAHLDLVAVGRLPLLAQQAGHVHRGASGQRGEQRLLWAGGRVVSHRRIRVHADELGVLGSSLDPAARWIDGRDDGDRHPRSLAEATESPMRVIRPAALAGRGHRRALLLALSMLASGAARRRARPARDGRHGCGRRHPGQRGGARARHRRRPAGARDRAEPDAVGLGAARVAPGARLR